MADVIRVAPSARLQIKRNGTIFHDQIYAPEEESYTIHSGDRIVLAAAMGAPQEADLGDIDAGTPGSRLMLTTDRTIYIAVNDVTKLVEVGEVYMIAGGTIETLYLQNTDATKTATVEFIITD